MLTLWRPLGIAHGTSATAPLFSDFGNLFRNFGNWDFDREIFGASPATDIVETEKEIQVKVDLPGHSLDEIHVQLEGDTLTVQAERKSEKKVEGKALRTERFFGVYSRSFVLPESVDGSKPEAHYAQGVLTVTLPKREEAKPKQIKVQVRE